ncbi:MAG: hypothetical protein AB1631_00870 [Acidobacteriota bacterium]
MNAPASHKSPLLLALLLVIAANSGCVFFHGQRYHHFSTRTPLVRDHILVLGFMGGREPWNNDKRAVRKLALKLRSMNLPYLHVETVENKKRHLAIELIRNAFDRNLDGHLDQQECASVRLILFGHSFGGAAVVKLARQLKRMNVPVSLTVQIDSIGRGDKIIPSNVSRAANLFQSNGLIIRGEKQILPEDPNKTTIIGNYRYDYRNKKVDIKEVSWLKKVFRAAHTKMEYDPEVWSKVEEMILSEIRDMRKGETAR